jgi:hypothetical protein
MYCSSCGVAVAQGLTFCNFCGARLNVMKGNDLTEEVTVRTEVKPELLVSGMVGVFVLGLAGISILIGVMKSVLDLDTRLIVAFTLLSFLIMLLVEGVCLRLLFHRNRGAKEIGATALSKEQTTRELDVAQVRALPEPVPSVTEHTTRPFDPIYNKRTSK